MECVSYIADECKHFGLVIDKKQTNYIDTNIHFYVILNKHILIIALMILRKTVT